MRNAWVSSAKTPMVSMANGMKWGDCLKSAYVLHLFLAASLATRPADEQDSGMFEGAKVS